MEHWHMELEFIIFNYFIIAMQTKKQNNEKQQIKKPNFNTNIDY